MNRFVIDDAPWAPAQISSAALDESLVAFADRLQTTNSRREQIGFYVGIWDVALVGADTLSTLIYERENPRRLSRDVRTRLSRLFDQLAGNTFDETGLPSLEVDIQGARFVAPAVVVAWGATATRRAIGCITPTCSGRVGALPVGVNGIVHPIHFVTNEATHVAFFRDAVSVENADERGFAILARSAFPLLQFVEGVFGGLRDFSRPFRDRRGDLVFHLSVLNDAGARIFALAQNQRIEAEFRALQVIMSPETRETIADGRCRRARERVHGDETLVFDWHMKVEPQIDRIHVHPGTAASAGRVLVGIFHAHLPLPQD